MTTDLGKDTFFEWFTEDRRKAVSHLIENIDDPAELGDCLKDYLRPDLEQSINGWGLEWEEAEFPWKDIAEDLKNNS